MSTDHSTSLDDQAVAKMTMRGINETEITQKADVKAICLPNWGRAKLFDQAWNTGNFNQIQLDNCQRWLVDVGGWPVNVTESLPLHAALVMLLQ